MLLKQAGLYHARSHLPHKVWAFVAYTLQRHTSRIAEVAKLQLNMEW